jgi:hypothetical protein
MYRNYRYRNRHQLKKEKEKEGNGRPGLDVVLGGIQQGLPYFSTIL